MNASELSASTPRTGRSLGRLKPSDSSVICGRGQSQLRTYRKSSPPFAQIREKYSQASKLENPPSSPASPPLIRQRVDTFCKREEG
jgi:hypothetical protein